MKEIYDYLRGQGISQRHNGFLYLGHAIEYALNNPGATLNACYEHAATCCGTSGRKVCGDIRYALSSSSHTKGIIPKQFINEAVYHLKKY